MLMFEKMILILQDLMQGVLVDKSSSMFDAWKLLKVTILKSLPRVKVFL